jgi:hypothetical protein
MNLDKEHLQKKWDEVRLAELTEIETRRKKAQIQGDAKENLVGLALSGGGIRSASFNLGVLQALVSAGLFRYIDFLSTVSGGGYIGAFLSSLAYRRHLDNAAKKQPDAPYQEPSIKPNLDGSQPDDTKSLAKNSNFLNDKLEFVSRYLIGWFLNFFTLFSGLVVVSTLLALGWRFLDMPVVVDLLIFVSNGLILEWNRPFLPAALAFLAWVLVWSWSYLMKGSVANAHHSGKPLIFAAVFFLVGCAIWLGTTNMNFTNSFSSSYNPQAQSYFNAHQDWIWPLAMGWLMTILPFLRPQELLKSGTDTKSAWKGWVFHIAGYSLLIGIPFVTVYYLGRHNISGIGGQWQREFVANDIIDADKFWKKIRVERQDFKENKGPLTPGILLLQAMEKIPDPETNYGRGDLVALIKDDWKLYRLQKNPISNWDIQQYYTDINTKNKIADLVSTSLNGEGEDYLQTSEHELEKEIIRLLNLFVGPVKWLAARLKDLLKSKDNASFGYNLFKDNVAGVKGLFIEVKNKESRERLRKSLTDQTSVDQPSDKMEKEQEDRLLTNLPDIINKLDTYQYRVEANKKIKKLTASPAASDLPDLQALRTAMKLNRLVELKEDPDAQKEARQLKEIVQQYEFYHQMSGDKEADKQTNLAKAEWMKKVYHKSGAGHLLLRLYYSDHLRPIQLANRPTVIMQDQLTRCWILLISGVIFFFFGAVVNFNNTSLHGFYRRCIQRGFLCRHASTDDEKEHRQIALKDMTNTDEGYPYHILTGCVEIETGNRGDPVSKAAFQFAKLYCGGPEIDFRKTSSYRKALMTLSSAAAISGAAISPTRVRYLLLKIIMIVTNLRLGQWLPNPAKKSDVFAPRFVPFLRLLWTWSRGGGTLDQSLLFVTDGGHYENLGIDVLLDRRCRLILASDAGADPSFEYFDLANLFAIARRKGIQFLPFQPGIAATPTEQEISLESVQAKFKKGERMAVWRVKYPEAGINDGLCVYIKSSLPDPQPFALGQYKLWHEDFPHDSTANQFFHEQEFEAYRDLGYHLAQNMIALLKFDAKVQDQQTVDVDWLLQTGVFRPTVESPASAEPMP